MQGNNQESTNNQHPQDQRISRFQAWLYRNFPEYRRKHSKRVCMVCPNPNSATQEKGRLGEDLSGPEAIRVFHISAEIWRGIQDPMATDPYTMSRENAIVTVRTCTSCRTNLLGIEMQKVKVVESGS